jgi:hypothetical protein
MRQHLTAQQIESYALCTISGQLSSRQAEPAIRNVEEHVILCDRCDRSVESFENYIRAIRTAAARLQTESGKPKSYKPHTKTLAAGRNRDRA